MAVADNCCDRGMSNLDAMLSAASRQDNSAPSFEPIAAQHPVAAPPAFVHRSHRYEPRDSNENRLVTVLRI
jgi:hypothetical protein